MKQLFYQTHRRSNGRFATAEQSEYDRVKRRNLFLENEVQKLNRKLQVFEKMVLNRKLII